MTPCYEPFKNLLIVLENAFEVIVKDKNNIFLRKTTKNAKKWGKTPFFQTAGGLPTCPQGSVGGVFNRPVGQCILLGMRAAMPRHIALQVGNRE